MTNCPRKILVVFALAAVVFSAGCDQGAAGGGGGGPGGALTILNTLPIDTGTPPGPNTRIAIQFNKPVNYASVGAHLRLALVDTAASTSTNVPLTQVTTFDATGDGSLAVYSPVTTLQTDTVKNGTLFYRYTVSAGAAALDGGLLAADYSVDFGTSSGPVTLINLPGSITFDGGTLNPGDTYYKNTPDFEIGATIASTDTTFALVVKLDDGGGLPGDIAHVYLTSPSASGTVTIPSPVSTTTYTVTLTFYDIYGNSVDTSFTLVYDTDAPEAPTALALNAADTSPTANTSVSVDVTYPGPVGPMDTEEIWIQGGASLAAAAASSSPQTVPVNLEANQTNQLVAFAVDRAGNVSLPGATLSVIHDDQAALISNMAFSPPLSSGGTNTIGTTSLSLQGAIISELSTVEIYNAAGNVLLASQNVLGNFVIPFSIPADTLTTINVYVSDYDQPSNISAPYTFDIYADTQVSPAPAITAASDGNGPCTAAPGNGTCVVYDTGSPPGFRTGSASIGVSGTVEMGSAIKIYPIFTFFVSAAADPATDVFPATGDADPVIGLAANTPFQVDLYAKDPLGNEVTVAADAEFIRDTLAPQTPTLSGLASSQGSCTSETFTASDPVTGGPVLSLVGTWANCNVPDLQASAADDPGNPDPAKGETYRLRARDSAGAVLTTSAAAGAPPSSASFPVTLPNAIQNSVGQVQLSALDAVGNESGTLVLTIVHRDSATTLLPAVPEILTNNGGAHDTATLAFSQASLVFTTRPTQATTVTIKGHTSPNADTVELRDSTNTTVIAGPVAPNAATGSFTITTDTLAANSAAASLTDTYYLRASGTGTTPLTVDTTLNITHDTRQPTVTPVAKASAPTGAGGVVAVTVTAPQTDPAGLDPTIAHAHHYSDAACATDLGVDVSDTLKASGAVQLHLQSVSVGQSVQVYLEDEAGNVSTGGSRLCLTVNPGHIVTGVVSGAAPTDRGLNYFNLDGADLTGTYQGNAGFDDPANAHYYGAGRLFVLNYESSGGTGLVSYDIASDSLNQSKISLAAAYNGFDTREDRGLVALLDTSTPSLGFLSVDSTPLISPALSEAPFPDLSIPYGIYPGRVILFPGALAVPQADWVLILRLKFSLSLTAGDALVFDVSAGDFVVPTPPFLPITKAGLATGPFPTDAVIPATDPSYALISNSSGLSGDASYADATILDFSACPPNCAASNFTSTSLVLTNETGGPINGLAGLRLFPSNENYALAVEKIDVAGTGSAIHLLDINWAAQTITTVKTLALPGQGLAGSVDLTSDETYAVAVSGGSNKLLVFDVNLAGPTISLNSKQFTVSPASAALGSAIRAEP